MQLHKSYEQKGRYLSVNGTKAFIYEQGQGQETVVCIHGVPATSFLYRKLIGQLAKSDISALSFDLIGMGLSDKPEDFDYSWSGIGDWCTKVIKALDIGDFHLVIHDIGGPIGCEVLANIPEKIKSVTILNTLLVGLPEFKKPFPMGFFPIPLIGEAFVKTTLPILFKQLMNLRGVKNKKQFGLAEAKAYTHFLKQDDGGAAFLKIMRSFEPTAEKEARYLSALQRADLKKQIIWGEHDQALTLEKYGYPLQKALGLARITKVSGAHFLQEDCAEEIAANIVTLIQA